MEIEHAECARDWLAIDKALLFFLLAHVKTRQHIPGTLVVRSGLGSSVLKLQSHKMKETCVPEMSFKTELYAYQKHLPGLYKGLEIYFCSDKPPVCFGICLL